MRLTALASLMAVAASLVSAVARNDDKACGYTKHIGEDCRFYEHGHHGDRIIEGTCQYLADHKTHCVPTESFQEPSPKGGSNPKLVHKRSAESELESTAELVQDIDIDGNGIPIDLEPMTKSTSSQKASKTGKARLIHEGPSTLKTITKKGAKTTKAAKPTKAKSKAAAKQSGKPEKKKEEKKVKSGGGMGVMEKKLVPGFRKGFGLFGEDKLKLKPAKD